MLRFLRIAIIVALTVCTVPSFARTFYIAANGNDANAGTKLAPWLHAPGMPNCANVCASTTPTAGDSFIFRGGDTWHFGNAAAAPYSGGSWDAHNWGGTGASCTDETNQSGCIYWGVDKTYFAGGSWVRPILTADNALSATTVASCTYTVPTNGTGFINTMWWVGTNSIVDNFEMTGLCASIVSGSRPGVDGTYLTTSGGGTPGLGMLFQNNLYIHGWSATTAAGGGDNGIPITIFGGGINGLQTTDHVVVDGADSVAGIAAWSQYISFYHFRYSIIRYVADGVGAWCHDIHDNIFEFFDNPIRPTHGNILECNLDATGDAPNQPANTPNVFYNNIVRHVTPAFDAGGNVKIWHCPNAIPEYWFNNILYDLGTGNFWDVAGGPTYPTCDNTGGQKMFNNTLVNGIQPCDLRATNTGTSDGRNLEMYNEHLIETTISGTGICTGRADASNISQNTATAISQGYAINSGQTDTGTTNCANEGTTPCGAVNNSVATVGAGLNKKTAYCDVLATFSVTEPAIGVTAAAACMKGTTDGCAYKLSDHTMQCPAQVAVARPTVAAWDSGAYFLNSGVTAPTCTLTAAPAVIKLGTSSTLTFTPANTPTGCSIDNGVGAVSCSGATPSVSPTTLTTYTATVTNAGGTNTCSASVTIGGCKISPNMFMGANAVCQ